MSFLSPIMLLGLAGLAIPTIVHLIARRRYQVHEFPSIRLLLPDDRANVFAMRLVDVGQLLLRLLVLLLLALAMARLFAPWWPFGRAPRNLAVVVDCSASMQRRSPLPPGEGRVRDAGAATLLEVAKAKARDLLAAVAPPGQSALVAAAEDTTVVLPLGRADRPLGPAVERLAAAGGTGRGLVHAVARCCEMLRSRREARSQIVVITDLAAAAFEARNQSDCQRIAEVRREMGNLLEIVFADVSGGRAANLAITEAAVRGRRVNVGDDAHVVARVLNSSAQEQKARVRLAVGSRAEPLIKEIALGPNAQADVDLTLRVNRAVQTFVEVGVQPDDALPQDNAFTVPLNVADSRRILIVHGGQEPSAAAPASPLGELGGAGAKKPESDDRLDGAKILRLALNPGRELGRPYGTGIQVTAIAPDALADQPLSKYDIVALYDVSSLPEQALKDLDTFVRQGRSLLFICSGGTNAMKFNRTFATAGAGRPALAPAELGNEATHDPPLGLRGGTHPVLAPFRDRLKGDLSTVRFTATRELRALAKEATTLLTGSDGRRLAVEMPIEHGRVVLLAFGVELQRGNLARTRVFPALLWQLVSYLAGELRTRPPDVFTASRPAALDVAEPPFAFLNELELCSAEPDRAAEAPPTRLAIREGRTVLLPGLPAGSYLLRKPAAGSRVGHVYARHVAVNADPRESDTTRAEPADLAALFGEGVQTLDNAGAASPVPAGGELWLPLVALLALAYAAEGAVGWALSARREKQRLEGGNG